MHGACLTAVLIAGALAAPTSTDDIHVGWIENIEKDCHAEWRDNDHGPAGRKLDPKADRHRFLYPGDSVRCKGPGKMTVQDHASLVPIGPKDGWRTLRRESSADDQEDKQAIAEFGRIAGRPRGSSRIFSPANDGVVRPKELVVRWTPKQTSDLVLLRLLNEEGTELWSKEGIRNIGELDSEELRTVLMQFRADNEEEQLRLTLAQGSSVEPSVVFTLLSVANERALEGDLARCEIKQGLLRYACRAYVLQTRRMWNDLVSEYDDALAAGPGSLDLMIASILAHRKIGDTATGDRLMSQLPSGTKLPE